MSILSGKNVLIVGTENPQIKNLKETLLKHRVNLSLAVCGEVTIEKLKRDKIDIVLLNHLHEKDTCTVLLESLKETELANLLPVFVLVENSEQKIQEALMNGAADYITTDEPVSSIVTKIKVIFGHPDNFSSANILEIPEDHAKVTKKGIKVFVIEDDPLLRTLLAVKFETSHIVHEFSVDGSDASEKILAFLPQVIILDLMLPQKSGFEVLEELKNNDNLKNIPVIVFSNRDSQEDKQRIFALGADRFYVKAMTDLSLLIETIEELADK